MSFIVPGLFWPAAVAYVGVAMVLAVLKLRTLQLSDRCRRLQALSVSSVFVGVALGGMVSWFA